MCKSEGIKLIIGQTIKEVDDEGYKYLGILELDKFKEREMKDIFRTEYLMWFKLVMKSIKNNLLITTLFSKVQKYTWQKGCCRRRTESSYVVGPKTK